PLRFSDCLYLLPTRIERRMHLVKRILITLLEFLATDINALLPPQTLMLLLNLRHPSRLERRICSLEPTLRVPVDLGGILRRQRQRIESVVNAGRIKRRALLTRLIQLAEIQTSAGCTFLLRGFGSCAFGL